MKRLLLSFALAVISYGVSGCDRPQVISLEQKELTRKELMQESASADQASLRMAIGAMITPAEGFSYYRNLLDYVGKKLGMEVDFVDKTSYAEINGLLEEQEVDMAFVCSGPYVDGKKEFGLKQLVVPQAHGERVYYSYIIVPSDSPAQTFDDLRGLKFAFTDPQSNTGKLVPTYMLAIRNETPDSFFSTYVFTYAHDKSIQGVAQKIVDGAAVDSLIWEYVNKKHPELTSKTKIIVKSPPYGIPPVVVRPGLADELYAKLQDIFLTLHQSEEGRVLLEGMMIDKFMKPDDALYDTVREMKTWVVRTEGLN
jgi:phosphonate transport system substrate-binding protein